MIVKVQMPIAYDKSLAMVYNEDRSFDVLMEITDDLEKAMDGELKKFFHAEYDQKNRNTIIGEPVQDPGW